MPHLKLTSHSCYGMKSYISNKSDTEATRNADEGFQNEHVYRPGHETQAIIPHVLVLLLHLADWLSVVWIADIDQGWYRKINSQTKK